MLQSRGLSVSLLGTLLSASAAVGDVSVTPGTSGVHWTKTNIGGKYQIEFLPAASGTYTVNGTGAASDDIEYIEWARNSSNNITLSVGPDVSSVEAIRSGTTGTPGSRQVSLAELDVLGNLGPETGSPTGDQRIEAHQITVAITVAGDSMIPVRLLQPSSGNATFRSITVAGDLRGDIINDYGPIGSILVGGSIIGTETDPVIIRCLEDAIGGVNLTLAVGDEDPENNNGDIIHARIGQMTGTPTMIVASAQIERDMIADVRLKAARS